MQYRRIPKNGDSLSILGFGCMRLPLDKKGRIDELRAIRQIRHAIDNGVNYVDTAWPYHGGESELLVGKALCDGYRERAKVATKLPVLLVKSRADMDRFLDAQLKKLGVDQIDYYLLHALSGSSWDVVERLGVIDFIDRARADGRIINAGFSFHGLLADFKRIVDAYPWMICQIQYNFLDQKNQAGAAGLKYAAARDIGIVIMEPLRGGDLGRSTPPPAVDALWKTARLRRSPVAWALLWLWNQPEVGVVLSGMNDETHVAENLAIADKASIGGLNRQELALVDRVGEKYRELMKVGCTGCGYCMPCPSGVIIPGCFEVYNKMHMFGDAEIAKFSYALRMSGDLSMGQPGYASQCIQCGTCLEKCPQAIPIPDLLAGVAAEMEGDDLQARLTAARQMFQDPQK